MRKGSTIISDAVIYCRVSSKRQEEDGNSLFSQEAACRELAAKNDWTVLEVFSESITGAKHSRPQWDALKAYIKKRNKPCYIIVLDSSRFARGMSVHHQNKHDLKTLGAKLVFVNGPVANDELDADAIRSETLNALDAELERVNIRNRVTRGLKTRAQEGLVLGTPPFGYICSKSTIGKNIVIICPQVGSVVQEGLKRLAEGSLNTQRQLAQFIAQHVPNFKEARVKAMLDKLYFYAGYIHYPQHDVHMKRGEHAPLITEETYQKILNQTSRLTRSGYRRNPKNEELFPLRGFLTCAHCKSTIHSAPSTSKGRTYLYYACKTKGCPGSVNTAADKVHDMFLSLIGGEATTQMAAVLAFRELWKKKLPLLKTQHSKACAELKKTKDKFHNLITHPDGHDPLLLDLQTSLRRQIITLQKKVNNLARMISPEMELHLYQRAAEITADPCKAWRDGSRTIRRAIQYIRFGGDRKVHFCPLSGIHHNGRSFGFRKVEE